MSYPRILLKVWRRPGVTWHPIVMPNRDIHPIIPNSSSISNTLDKQIFCPLKYSTPNEDLLAIYIVEFKKEECGNYLDLKKAEIKESVWVMSFHSCLAKRGLLNSSKLLNPSPPSFKWRHISFHETQCTLEKSSTKI